MTHPGKTLLSFWSCISKFTLQNLVRPPYRKLNRGQYPSDLRLRGNVNQPESDEPQYHGPQNNCFGCGQISTVGLHLVFETAPDLTVHCTAVISDQYEGPPGYLHGGIIATVLDEAMSKANRAGGVTAMTRQMTVEYLRPVPSNAPVQIMGSVTRSEGRKHWTQSQIQNAEGRVLAQATGLFIAIF
jgi:uncharacterized protein (TIGR00369 family)